jgi:hypothetical protein
VAGREESGVLRNREKAVELLLKRRHREKNHLDRLGRREDTASFVFDSCDELTCMIGRFGRLCFTVVCIAALSTWHIYLVRV